MEAKLTYVAKTGGIKTEETGDVWLNPANENKSTILANLDKIKSWKGKTVVIEMIDEKTFSGIGLSDVQDEEENSSDSLLNRNHIINIRGKEFVTFDGLLDVAHTKGLESIETEMISSDFENNIFVFKAKVKLKDGRVCESYGDAKPDNVGELVAVHSLRMAETRAIARALRWATNVGMCSLDEIGEIKKDEVKENGAKTFNKDKQFNEIKEERVDD